MYFKGEERMFRRILLLLLITASIVLQASSLPNNLTSQEKDYLRNHFDEYLASKHVDARALRVPTSIASVSASEPVRE